MALCRGLRRRMRQTNPCTTCLVVLFIAVVFYLISAIRSTYSQSTGAALVAEGPMGSNRDGRRLAALDDAPAGIEDKTGSFVVGDDEIQFCTMTSTWASSGFDHQDYDHLSTENRQPQDDLSLCSAISTIGPVPTLFYIDVSGELKYNHTAAKDGKYEVVGNCLAWKIEWNFDTGYVQKNVSLLAKIDSDFIHVSCRVRRNIDSGSNDDDERRDASHTTPIRRPRQRRSELRRATSMTTADITERRARQIHRDQLLRHSPHIIGTVGLPDPLSSAIIAEHRTSSQNAADKRATPNKQLEHKHDGRLATHTADQSKLVEHIDSRESRGVHNLFRSGRDLNHKDKRRNADKALTEAYDQWIARIQPLNEVVERKDNGDWKVRGRLDVLVLALESVSSVAFDKRLPKLHRFLINQQHIVMFTGYNVIGDAAPANIIPLLTGSTYSELKSQGVGGKHANYIDSLPFVWNKFEQAGYVTLYAEDGLVAGGDTFHTDFYGFEQPPVHHYMRPFWQAAAENITRPGCLGTMPEHKHVFRYVEQFLSVNNGSRAAGYPAHIPRFAFAFVSGSADNDLTSLSQFDDDLFTWLEKLQRSGLLERTVVIVVGDHGPSYGPRRHTMLGKTEERLPLLVVSVPTWFAERHPEMTKNLATNSDRLVTPLDVHQTLLDILDVTAQRNSSSKTAAWRKHRTMIREKAISLLDKIPIGRTCQSAGIAVHWCMCTYTQSVPAVLDEWQLTAQWVVDHINDLLRPAITSELCQQLTLTRLVHALYVIPTDLVVDVENRFYYERRLSNFTSAHPSTLQYQQVIVETSPVGATFEATVVFNPETKTRQLSGEISRISAYGEQSDCVLEQHPHLRRFCICK